MRKKLLYMQAAMLAGGVFLSASALAGQFRIFYGLYGTIFRFRDCAIPNPFVTPCLYGAIAFLVAFVWAAFLIGSPRLASEMWLRRLLVFGVVFAFSVFGYELVEYYRLFGFGGPSISCTPGAHPLATQCFYGALIFTAASGIATIIIRSMRREGGYCAISL